MTSGDDKAEIGDPPASRRYAVAVACMAVAFAVRYFLTPLLGEELPFMMFIAAALVAAWYGGAAAGILALLIGLFLADWFFLSRVRAGLSSSTAALYLVRYIFTASVGVGLIEAMHRNRRRLQEEVARRRRSEADLREAHAELSRHAGELERRVEERTAKLTHTVESLQSLLYHIAHNFRAPLRAVDGYTSLLLLEHGAKLDEKATQYARQTLEAARRMDELIHDLLEYGRLGHIEIALSGVSLQRALDGALVKLAFEIRARQAEIKVVGPLPVVQGNPQLLEEVLVSLLENAISFTAPGTLPRVEVRAETCGPAVRLWVEDNGVGIEPRFHERIFGVFQTLSPSGGLQGTGIGLAIVKQAVERMGGKVGVDSHLGVGSRFWIELPGP
ncbi:putative Integral membrane sensor signal transduction histidine kinase [Verrucomicrobia bacterium]|nr:putative Integral membrane sensor signal transduction histidine kinase [Verrucomicrobiota bacterium]